MNAKITRNDAGLSLIEIMWVAGIMSVGLVMLMGSVIQISAANKAAEATTSATNFNVSVMESMRGRGLEDILKYNEGSAEFVVGNNGEIVLEGVGEATFQLFCVVPPSTPGTAPGLVQIPFSDSQYASMSTSMTNPIEVQTQIKLDKGFGSGKEFKFYSSTLLYY